jgi:uncharacterized membrane protein YbhN (UPF0104 family)
MPPEAAAVQKTPRATPIAALFVGQTASAFLPMRAGEAVRTELLARATGMGRAAALGTVALDHSVNGLGEIISKVRSGLVALRNPAAVATAAAYSAAWWAVEICVTMLALAAFQLPHDLPHAMAVLFGVNLAQAIHSPPASLGNFELGAGMALVAFGGSTEHAAAFAIGYHAMQLLPTLFAGGLMLSRFRGSVPPPSRRPAGAET